MTTPERTVPPKGPRSPRVQFFLACGVGGLLALVVFAWLLLEGRADLFEADVFTNFYDAQAHSWLEGRWDVSGDILFFERFNVGGKFYMYHGPWPALLRLPVVIFTDDLDGELSRISMLLAFSVFLASTSRVLWQARSLLRGSGEPTRAGLVAAGAFVFVAGCGSTAIFLGSFAWVYHEALLWGLAWSIASFSCLITYIAAPSRRALVLASITATFACLSRGSVGIGPVAAIGIVLVVRAGRRALDARRIRHEAHSPPSSDPWWQRALGIGGPSTARVWPLALATAVPLASYGTVNYIKFRSFFGEPPVKFQDLILRQHQRAAALAANNNSLFGIKFAPTNILQYLRLDGIGFDPLFPWANFAGRPTLVGDPVYDRVEGAGSIVAVSTLLVVFAVLGIIAVVRAPRVAGSTATTATLRAPVLGAVLGCSGMLVIAFIAQRYEADFVPLLVVLGSLGMWWVAHGLTRRTRPVRVAIVVVLTILAAWSCWANAALAVRYQRSYNAFVTRQTRATFVGLQLDVYEHLAGGAPSNVEHGDRLPRPSDPGSLFVVGDCDALYLSIGESWSAVEQSPATGRTLYRVKFPRGKRGTRVPLVATGGQGQGTSVLWARYFDRRRVRLEFESTAAPDTPRYVVIAPDFAGIGGPVSGAIPVGKDRTLDLIVRFDPAGYASVLLGDKVVVSTLEGVAAGPMMLGRVPDRPSLPRFAGTIRPLVTPTPVCDHLRRLERDAADP